MAENADQPPDGAGVQQGDREPEAEPSPLVQEDQPQAGDSGPASNSKSKAADEHESIEPDDLHDETAAPDADWALRNDQLRQQSEDSLREIGVDPDGAVHIYRPAVTGGRSDTGSKIAAGSSSIAAEQFITHITGARPDRARSAPLSGGLIRSATVTHVKTPEFETLLATLREHNVAYLTGHDGTGRLATTYAALAKLCGADQVVSIDLNEDADLSAVLDQSDLLHDGHGHVLELAPTQLVRREQTLRTAGGRLAHAQAYLVVIGPPGGKADRQLDSYEVVHHRPDATLVLHSHLTVLLRACEGWSEQRITGYVDECLADVAITEHLRKSLRPSEIVLLARRLVDIGNGGGRPADGVQLLPSTLLQLAREVLCGPDEDDAAKILRRLTARIAYALWNGSSHTVVFDVASRLLSTVSDKDGPDGAPSTRTVFDSGIESLVDPRMRGMADTDGSDEARGIPAEPNRRARLVDPELARAVLDVVWHDYDHLRVPMLRWLGALGTDRREQVRMRAGQVAGQLATYAFDFVYRELLRPWATSPRKEARQAAAWAMERAVLDAKLTARACRQVRDWAYSRDAFMNDTAARAYATRLGSVFADDALTNLWLVALRPGQQLSPAVAQAVAQIYQPDQPESGLEILGELLRWVQDGERRLEVHAALALTLLAYRMAPPPDDSWPALLHLASENKEAADQLTRLWRIALLTEVRAWDALLTWLIRANKQGELEDAALRFTNALIDASPVRLRALFYLKQWLPRYPDISILRRLRDSNRRDGS